MFNSESQQVLGQLEHTTSNLLITGPAGTGKSSLLHHFRATTQKQVVVLAPTGVAALNVGGQTIHSFCRFRPGVTLDQVHSLGDNHRHLYSAIDTLIIDEISMVRADLFDCIEKFLRLNGRVQGAPFGGVQMVFVGDLYQLPPVVPKDEAVLFRTLYASPYFFDGWSYPKAQVTTLQLTQVYRQREAPFVALLEALRTGALSDAERTQFNAQCFRRREMPVGESIQLMTTNDLADRVNHAHLERLGGQVQLYAGKRRGTFGEGQLPTHKRLRLRPEARVMLLNNDADGGWINGDLGTVLTLPERENPHASIVVQLDRGGRVEVSRHTWEVIRFGVQRDRIEPEVIGSFTQYPLRLAWAVTIHKVQGKTFDHVVVDFGRGTFAPGQAYVALSRCTTMAGLVLRRPLQQRHVWRDERITDFLKGAV